MPNRTARELVDVLRVRAGLLSGQPWEGPATAAMMTEAASVIEVLRSENARLETALRALIIDANRLCDRQLGGTYEEDARRSIQAARAAVQASR